MTGLVTSDWTPGARLADVLPAVLCGLGMQLGPDHERAVAAHERLQLGEYRQACVVLVDGLGWENLSARWGHAPFLRQQLPNITQLQTCFPSTTAAAITTLGTGREPGVTKMAGYSVRDERLGGLVNLINFANAKVAAQDWQTVPTLFERFPEVAPIAVTPRRFLDSGLTNAALRGTQHSAGDRIPQRIDAAVEQLRRGRQLVYLYWRELDHIGHPYGWQSSEWTTQLEALDSALAELVRRVPTDTLVLVTADHGMVDTSSERRIDLAENKALAQDVVAVAGEPRALHLHLVPGTTEAVKLRWQAELGGRGVVLGRQEAALRMGGGPGPVGDLVVACTENWVVVDSRTQSPGMIGLIGVHGSLTPVEMLVPLVVAKN